MTTPLFRGNMLALGGIALACAGFAAGATWGAARTRVAIEAEHLDEVIRHDSGYVLTASCTLLMAVQDLAEGPGESRVDALDQAAHRVLEAQSGLASIDFDHGGLVRRFRSPWWLHSFDAVADQTETYRSALENLSRSVGAAQHVGNAMGASGKADSAALAAIVINLRDAVEQTTALSHDDPSKWPCWRRAAGL